MQHSYIKYYLFSIIACLLQLSCSAQEQRRWAGFGVEADAIAGRVFKQETKFTVPIPPLSTALNINLVQRTYGKKAWHKNRHYPTLGVGICYINFGIDSVYGRSFTLYPNITTTLLRGKKMEWTLTLGDGPTYVTTAYHRTTPVNTTNIALGSRINNFVRLASHLQYHINEHWDVRLGANLEHMSNSSYRKPNLGINMPGGHVGVVYYPVTSRPKYIENDAPQLKNRWLIQMKLSMATVASFTAGGPSYPVYIATGYVSRRLMGNNKVFAGLDHAYYENLYAYQKNNELNVGHERQNAYKNTVLIGDELLFGRLSLVFQGGFYLRKGVLPTPSVYEKLGGHYYLVQREKGPIKEFFLSAMVKTHLNVAELGEFGIGFGF